MGLLDKVKGILFDEEEIEIPEINKEERKHNNKKNDNKVEEENPIKELKIPKDDFKDKEYRSESTFTFPIDFEEEETIKDEEVIEKEPKKDDYIKDNYDTDRHNDKDFSSFLNSKNERKRFKPTPIISPVYGVLDQNYKKEDVIVKGEVLKDEAEPTLEMVRKKAFGSLEEDLEDNLITTKEIKITETKKQEKKPKKEEVEKPVSKLKTIGELINEEEHSLDIPDLDSIKEEIDEQTKDEKLNTKSISELLNDDKYEEEKIDSDAEIDDEESDLFSLIDSMYEEKGE